MSCVGEGACWEIYDSHKTIRKAVTGRAEQCSRNHDSEERDLTHVMAASGLLERLTNCVLLPVCGVAKRTRSDSTQLFPV